MTVDPRVIVPGALDAPAPPTAAWAARLRSVDPVVAAASALVLVVPLTAVVSSVRHPWVGIHDWVLMEQAVRRVGTADTPLVGAPSRFGWHHPGPWPYYVMAPFHRLVPADVGLLFAAAMTNLLATAGFVALAVRQPRARALVALFGLAVLLRGLGVGLLVDPWNPSLALVPLALYLLLCVEIARGEGRRWAVPVAFGVGAFAVQAHLGLLVPVVLVGAATAALARRRPGGWGSWWVPALVGTVAWLPPVIDQLFGDGNLWRLARWTAGAELLEPGPWEEGRLAAGEVVSGAAWLLDPGGLWAGRWSAPSTGYLYRLGDGTPWRLLLLVALLSATGYLATRLRAPAGSGAGTAAGSPSDAAGEGDEEGRRAAADARVLAAVGVVAVVAGLAGTRGLPFLWSLRWAAPVVMLAWVAFGWAVAAAVAGRFPPRSGSPSWSRALPAVVVLALIAVPVALAVWRGTTGVQPSQEESTLWLAVRDDLLADLRRHGEPVVLQPNPFLYGDEWMTLELLVEREGLRWVPGDDPEAADRPSYHATLLRPDDLDEADRTDGIVARSGVATEGRLADHELIVIRAPPPPDHPPAWPG